MYTTKNICIPTKQDDHKQEISNYLKRNSLSFECKMDKNAFTLQKILRQILGYKNWKIVFNNIIKLINNVLQYQQYIFCINLLIFYITMKIILKFTQNSGIYFIWMYTNDIF